MVLIQQAPCHPSVPPPILVAVVVVVVRVVVVVVVVVVAAAVIRVMGLAVAGELGDAPVRRCGGTLGRLLRGAQGGRRRVLHQGGGERGGHGHHAGPCPS